MADKKVYPGFVEELIGSDGEGFAEYRKTAIAKAKQIDHDFIVESPEGNHEGFAGDYLMCGAAGELYVCAQDIFYSTYEPVD